MPAEVRYSILAQLIDFIYIGEIKLAAEDVNSFIALAKHLKIRGLAEIEQKQNMEKVLRNSWTSDQPNEDQAEQIHIEKTTVQELNLEDKECQDELVIQDEVKIMEDISSPVQEETCCKDSELYSTSNGLRKIKFQCHQCRMIFCDKAAFATHIIRAHRPDFAFSGLNFTLIYVKEVMIIFISSCSVKGLLQQS
jgi:hypothetical protein